jgi:hypothetical protein
LRDVISNTSPLQYLHQLGLLRILPSLAGRVWVPSAVVAELAAGRKAGLDLPAPEACSWVTVKDPADTSSLPAVPGLGNGEREVLLLGLELRGVVMVLDDALARRVAGTLRLPFTGTLGVLLDAKRARLLPAVAPCLDRLQALRFRVSDSTRATILRLAGE